MNIQDLSLELGVSLNANVLQPAPGDLLILKVEHQLKPDQRTKLIDSVVPKLSALGCKVLVLEAGFAVQLIKQVEQSPVDETAPVAQAH
ncbi:hypothetical protein N5D61_05240 [Pseudomonas sp. GD03842]|uniref:hypothetical protein n=1 Tax=Pseudomonas sp. GD03842 TaxID=2975385 RepID=UPI00244C8262|nr:hypothetical protein [Pseudomonas sp. GD03842]MDH0745744.1 hypothetical protein [Pseudomonas sp. GD03842]